MIYITFKFIKTYNQYIYILCEILINKDIEFIDILDNLINNL